MECLYKESFQAYAMDRLALMHGLSLSERDSINMLISGIGNQSLRALAATLRTDTVDEFLDEMHRVAAVTSEPDQRKRERKANSGRGVCREIIDARVVEDLDTLQRTAASQS